MPLGRAHAITHANGREPFDNAGMAVTLKRGSILRTPAGVLSTGAERELQRTHPPVFPVSPGSDESVKPQGSTMDILNH